MPTSDSGRSTSSSAEDTAAPADVAALAREADSFAARLLGLLKATLPGDHAVSIERRPPYYIVHTASHGGQRSGHVPLYSKGAREPIALFSLSMRMRSDRSGKYLAVQQSGLMLKDLDRRPLVRLEFEDNARKKPSCHWQFHGQNHELDRILHRTRPTARAARSLSHLHFPVGGARMRPGIEDFLQFLVQECGFASAPGWRSALLESRAEWRIRQTKTIVRDAPGAAAAALAEQLGVRVLRLARLARAPHEVGDKFARW